MTTSVRVLGISSAGVGATVGRYTRRSRCSRTCRRGTASVKLLNSTVNLDRGFCQEFVANRSAFLSAESGYAGIDEPPGCLGTGRPAPAARPRDGRGVGG